MSEPSGTPRRTGARRNDNAGPSRAETVMRRSQITCALVTALMGFLYAAAANAQEWIDCPASATMPQGGPQPTVSYRMLSDVCFIEQFPASSLPILLYDDFSWRSFIALAWPAKDGQSGVLDGGLALASAG